jgi:methylated-DNA-protein-cysteine methyltransferase-like protein
MALIGRVKINSVPAKKSTNFKQTVIEIAQQIPRGRVTTYGTIAVLAGLPRGARLVGGILHYNSEQFNLPWQRVINRNGFISTRCEDHTRVEQKELLEAEGIEVGEDFMIDLQKFGWFGATDENKQHSQTD